LAIQQAETHACAESDPIMPLLQSAEVKRLRTALKVLVPYLAESLPDDTDVVLSFM
jgi:hypothetical protein